MIKFSGNRLLLATRNIHKIREMTLLLQPLDIQLYSALDLEMTEPQETGTTFEENARIKANAYGQACDMPVLADDSGLCIDALDGFPGVDTAPFAVQSGGHTAAAEVLRQRLIGKNPRAAFYSCLVLRLPDGRSHACTAHVFGHLVFPPRGHLSWGFDPIFMPDGQEKTYGEMTIDEKSAIEHRTLALKKIIEACF